ncbi:signal peptide peptidase-domain-containing protein [Usnea florida]
MERLASFLQAVGYYSVTCYPSLAVYPHLLISALLPIYAGAHASLSRPSSAAKAPSKDGDDGHDEQGEQKRRVAGLDPMDALLLPLMSGLVLTSLYFLIKWVDDPAVLSKFLNWYCAVIGVWSVTLMIRDTMSVFTSFVYPQMGDMDGRESKQILPPSGALPQSSAPSLSTRISNAMRNLRTLQYKKLDVRIYIHNLVQARFKIGPQDVTSLFLAVVVLTYFNFIAKPWWLTSLIGFAFAYSSLEIMSPTTSCTGTLLLSALFVYDIYFVFFTPLMVTVATQLDIPAKLIFPRPSRPFENPSKQAFSMLGLGDVVLPGMMIGFALRFDLYLFYLRQQTQRVIKDSESEVIKAAWHPATGGWGERFWTSRDELLKSRHFQGVLFPKTYFHASLIGYVLGMLCTFGVMEVYHHAQPALLYLVPGVLGALWGTALIKGDFNLLWNYDEEEEVKESEARQNMNGHANKAADIKATTLKHLSTFERDRKSELVFIAVNLRSRDDGRGVVG